MDLPQTGIRRKPALLLLCRTAGLRAQGGTPAVSFGPAGAGVS
jgi:hypothetical protein